jgi:hypothetical protein
MANCVSALVYGVNARTCDLISAGRAYAKISPTLAGLARIQRLRDKGILRVNHLAPFNVCPGVERVPPEVWSIIEQEVITSAVRDARLEMLEQVVCKACDQWRAEAKADDAVACGTCAVGSEMLIEHFKFEAKLARQGRWRAKVFATHWLDLYKHDEDCEDVYQINHDWVHSDARAGLNSAVSSNF